MSRPSFARRAALGAALLLAVAACKERELVPTGLPPEFAIRSDVPYVRGTIVERQTIGGGGVRILVRDEPGSDWRVTEAWVTPTPDAVLRWPDGRAATTADLTRGRAVMVFATGAELRSLPPQVASNAILVGRR